MKNALRILQVFPIITKLKTMRQFYFFMWKSAAKWEPWRRGKGYALDRSAIFHRTQKAVGSPRPVLDKEQAELWVTILSLVCQTDPCEETKRRYGQFVWGAAIPLLGWNYVVTQRAGQNEGDTDLLVPTGESKRNSSCPFPMPGCAPALRKKTQ